MKILLAEDSVDYRETLKGRLEGEGYSVTEAANGDIALVKLSNGDFDLALLDIDMPCRNGLAVCRELRKLYPAMPVVVLTEHDSSVNEIRALDLGADYFVSKLADREVLFAALRRALARTNVPSSAADAKHILVGEVVVDASHLTRTEADLLRYFVSRCGEIVTRDDIVRALRGSIYACEDSLVYTHVGNLRRKLADFGVVIETVHSRGYRLSR